MLEQRLAARLQNGQADRWILLECFQTMAVFIGQAAQIYPCKRMSLFCWKNTIHLKGHPAIRICVADGLGRSSWMIPMERHFLKSVQGFLQSRVTSVFCEVSNCAKNDRQQIRCSHSWPGRNAENPSESKEIMCADILVGRDAFLQCIAARDKSNYVKRKHGTHIVFFVILLYLFDSEVCTRCNSHVFLGPLEKANIRSVLVATYLGFPSFGARTCQHRVREDRPCCSAPPFHRRLDNAKILQRDPPDV